MPRGDNAQLAADMYKKLRAARNWTATDAWKGIAELLLTCEVQRGGAWAPFHNVVVYRESNDFYVDKDGKPSAAIEKAERLSAYLAGALGCSREDLCGRIGAYWRHPQVKDLQFHNLVGHAFRSCVVEILSQYGALGIQYEEEVAAAELFKGWKLSSRSRRPKIDILAYKGQQPVAMLSTRWRFRHDRVDFIDEAHSYSAAAGRMYSGFPYCAVMGEFSPPRVSKVLENVPNPIAAAVHFCPDLITKGLGEDGRTSELQSLDWLVRQTKDW